jgi:hypothetical protein
MATPPAPTITAFFNYPIALWIILHYSLSYKIIREVDRMIRVLARVAERHPDMTDIEVIGAWEVRIKTQYRLDGEKPYKVAVGVSPSGRLVELIAFDDDGDTIIFHAMKATKNILVELGIL